MSSSVQINAMVLSIVLICALVKIVVPQQLVSPCPGVFEYETNPNEPDRWYGTATLLSDSELNGIWFRILLDKTSIQLGNWFGQAEFRDNNTGYIIKNPRHKLQANVPFKIRFYVRYNPNEGVPRLVSMRLNARQICPAPDNSRRPIGNEFTEAPQGTGQLFTTKPEKDSLEGDFYPGDYVAVSQDQDSSVLDRLTCGTVVQQPRPLITHGQATHEGEFPWHAALYHSQGIDLTYTCGASLISLKHLITVAQCVTRKKSQQMVDPDNLVVYLGKFYLQRWRNPGIQDKHVDTIIVHPQYNPQVFSNDIAILKLIEAVQLTNYVRPVCLWEGPTQLEQVVDKIGTVVGWGFDETGKVTEELTKASMPIVSQETCIYSYPDFYSRFTNSMTFCAGFQNGTSVCNGDSGGGLVLPKAGSDPNNPVYQIRGLVSISSAVESRLRCDSSHYVVFTDVAKYGDFIKKALAV